jgi:quinol monooxygenase YgiN
MPEELDIIARFHARPGRESDVEAAIRAIFVPTRAEPGCIGYQVVRGTRDPALFFIHSRWVDEAAFEHHATLAHTVRFLEAVQPLIDHPLDVARARTII